MKEAWSFSRLNWGALLIFSLICVLLFVLPGVVCAVVLLLLQAHDPDVFDDDWISSDPGFISTVTDPSMPTNTYPEPAFPGMGYSDYWYGSDDIPPFGEWGIGGIIFVSFIVSCVFCIFWASHMAVGLFMAVAKAMREQTFLKVCDVFSAFKCNFYWRLLCVSLIISTMVNVGYHIFILPGIYFSMTTGFALMILADNKNTIGMWRSITHSISLSTNLIFKSCGACCRWFGFMCLVGLVSICGIIFPPALLFTVPMSFVMSVFAYNHVLGINGLPITIPANSPCLVNPGANPSDHPLIYTS
jgi:hypothetical protein